jgi:uncharacterized protein (DUF2384 family)
MTDPKQINPDAFAALQASFQKQSRKAQAYYTAMHAAARVLKTEDAASTWMEQPLPAFGGKSPAQLVQEGREQDVLAHIGTLKG